MFRSAFAAASALLLSASLASATTMAANFLDMPFTTLDKGNETGIVEGGYHVFTSEADFFPFWEEHSAGQDFLRAIPAIDWESEMVLAVFLGAYYGGTGDIEITQIDLLGAAVFAHVDRRGELSARPVLDNPFHIVVMDRWEMPVLFPDLDLSPVTLESGWSQDNVLPDLNIVVENRATWNRVWAETHADDVEAPEVDFEQHMVLALSSGMVPTPGHGIRLAWAEVVEIRGLPVALAMVENVVPTRPAIMIPGYAWQFVRIDRPAVPLHVNEFTQSLQ